jgi:Uncharacterised nucleotidyltransferase
LLPLLQALVADAAQFDLSSVPPAVVNRAIANGFGPILARVTRAARSRNSQFTDAIESADLTSRLLTADMLEAVAGILQVTSQAGRMVMLKGCSTCVRYYQEPHLRPMGDIDLLVVSGDFSRIESLVRSLGFVDTTATPPRSWYEQHHHSIPLWHPERRLWIELHTRLYPPSSPLARDDRFEPDAIAPFISAHELDGQPAAVFSHELQLVYTATRWAGMPSVERGAFPVLDAALLIGVRGATLDWRQVCALVEGTWATTALRLMLTYLDRWRLAAVPGPVLRHLAAEDRFTNPVLIRLLHMMITTFIMEGRPLGTIVTTRNWRTTWSGLVGPRSHWGKPIRVAMDLAFPVSEQDRFGVATVVRRIRTAMGK